MLNEMIKELFEIYWTGDETLASIDKMRKQLHKNLNDQMNGYWSGSSAYNIMISGGFLVDGKRGTNKVLTMLGTRFMYDFKKESPNE